MEYRQLRYFAAAADLGNIGLAAAKLNVSQPPVTRQIQALEAELGVLLLRRTSRGVELTDAGRVFREEVRRILERTNLARERTRLAHEGLLGRLDIAYFGTAIYSVVPQSLRAFRSQYPKTTAQLIPQRKGEQVESVLSGRVHIAFGRYFSPLAGLRIKHLGKEPLFAAVPDIGGRDPNTTITMSEIAHHALVLFPAGDRPGFADEVLAAFASLSPAPRIEAIAFDLTSALAMVGAGVGIALLPQAVAAVQFPGVTFHKIEDCPISVPLACIYAEDDQTPVLTKYLATLESLYPSS